MRPLEDLREIIAKYPKELTEPFKNLENMTIPDIVDEKG